MPRHADWEINIRLGQVPNNKVGLRDDYFKIVHDVYTTQYLEAMGVEPSERYRRVVARNAPLEKCEIEATWAEQSAVASQLIIKQPQIGRGPAAKALETEGAQARAAANKIIRDFHGPEVLVDAIPPEVEALKPKEEAKRNDKDWREVAFAQMQHRDIENSKGANPELTEEMERLQTHARGDESSLFNRAPVLVQWGEEGDRELEMLKRKFILPFACAKSAKGAGPLDKAIVMVPWQSPELQAKSQIEVPAEHLAEVQQPINATLDLIHEEALDYVENRLPLELLSTRKDPFIFAALRERLECWDFVRLTGLSAHLLYWTVFGHLHPPDRRLPESTRQSLVLTMQELFTRVTESAKHKLVRRDSRAREFVLPVCMLVLKRGMEKVFALQYQKLFVESDDAERVTEELDDQINVMIMNLFDPDCAQLNFGALDSSMEAIKLWRKLHIIQMKLGLTPATRTLAREFRTTPNMLLLMHSDGNGPADPKTRKLLQKSSSDTVLAAVAGLPPEARLSPEAERSSPAIRGNGSSRQVKPHLDQHRRSALYRTACSRLSSAGQQAVSGSPIAA